MEIVGEIFRHKFQGVIFPNEKTNLTSRVVIWQTIQNTQVLTEEKFDETVATLEDVHKNPLFSLQRRLGFTFTLFPKGSFTTRMCKECVHNNRDHFRLLQ
jgi:hypothetical protein